LLNPPSAGLNLYFFDDHGTPLEVSFALNRALDRNLSHRISIKFDQSNYNTYNIYGVCNQATSTNLIGLYTLSYYHVMTIYSTLTPNVTLLESQSQVASPLFLEIKIGNVQYSHGIILSPYLPTNHTLSLIEVSTFLNIFPTGIQDAEGNILLPMDPNYIGTLNVDGIDSLTTDTTPTVLSTTLASLLPLVSSGQMVLFSVTNLSYSVSYPAKPANVYDISYTNNYGFKNKTFTHFYIAYVPMWQFFLLILFENTNPPKPFFLLLG
jgi:hypothetical protein